MANRFLDIAATPGVKAAQSANGSRQAYARLEGDAAGNDRLGAAEGAFIAARDSFYMATVSETGWPYLQHRGGPAGFLKVLDDRSIGVADFRGNRQYLSLGNLSTDNRVSLFLMDYANRRRLKIFARVTVHDLQEAPELAARLATPGYKAATERGFVFHIEAFDWNCPQHITPRFAEGEIAMALAPLHARLAALELENETLKRQLAPATLPRMTDERRTSPATALRPGDGHSLAATEDGVR